MPDNPPTTFLSLDTLVQSIADGEAVLVLGPDAIPLYRADASEAVGEDAETTFSRLSRRAIQAAPDISTSFFYERDNLFLFSNELSKNKARKEVRNLARSTTWLPDEELLRQIVAMPFPLVLSLSPDRVVYEAFERHWRAPQFDFCSPYQKAPGALIKGPDRANPLVFNLCGNVLEKVDSPILDYFDLFQLFTKLLSNTSEIPEPLRLKLHEADTYILLGFQLDRWYFQLFLHYLNGVDSNAHTNINQNFPFLSQVSEDAREFVLNQFNIRQVAPTRADFDALYQACRAKGILRELHEPLAPAAMQVRLLVTQNKLDEAFDLLTKQLGETEQLLDLPHLRARYRHWQQQQRDQTADSRDLEVEINKIRYTLLTYASRLNAAAHV